MSNSKTIDGDVSTFADLRRVMSYTLVKDIKLEKSLYKKYQKLYAQLGKNLCWTNYLIIVSYTVVAFSTVSIRSWFPENIIDPNLLSNLSLAGLLMTILWMLITVSRVIQTGTFIGDIERARVKRQFRIKIQRLAAEIQLSGLKNRLN